MPEWLNYFAYLFTLILYNYVIRFNCQLFNKKMWIKVLIRKCEDCDSINKEKCLKCLPKFILFNSTCLE